MYAVAVNKSAELKPSVEDGHVKICNMPRTYKHMQQSLTSCTAYIIKVKQKPSKQFSNLLLSRSNIRRAQVKVGLINLCKGLFSLNARIYYKLKSRT